MSRSRTKDLPRVVAIHSWVVMVYMLTVLIMAMSYTNPLYLMSLLVSVVVGITACRALRHWNTYLQLSLGMTGLIVAINLLAPH